MFAEHIIPAGVKNEKIVPIFLENVHSVRVERPALEPTEKEVIDLAEDERRVANPSPELRDPVHAILGQPPDSVVLFDIEHADERSVT